MVKLVLPPAPPVSDLIEPHSLVRAQLSWPRYRPQIEAFIEDRVAALAAELGLADYAPTNCLWRSAEIWRSQGDAVWGALSDEILTIAEEQVDAFRRQLGGDPNAVFLAAVQAHGPGASQHPYRHAFVTETLKLVRRRIEEMEAKVKSAN